MGLLLQEGYILLKAPPAQRNPGLSEFSLPSVIRSLSVGGAFFFNNMVDEEARAFRVFVSWIANRFSAGACVTSFIIEAVPPVVSDVKESACTDSGVAMLRGQG